MRVDKALIPPGVPPAAVQLSRIKPGTTVRLYVGARLVEGRWEGVHGDSARLGAGRHHPTVALADIDSAKAYVDAATTGALIGAGVLGAAGALAAAAVVGGMCESSDCDVAGALLLGGAVGGTLGSIIGGLLGLPGNGWGRVYARR